MKSTKTRISLLKSWITWTALAYCRFFSSPNLRMKIYLPFCKFFSNSENMLSWFGLSAHTLRVNSSDVWLGACFVCFIYSSSWNLSSVLLSCLSLSCDCQRVLSGELMVRFCNRRETLLVSHLGILREFKPMEDKGKINFERCSTNMTGQGIFFVFLEWLSFFRYLFAQSD